MSKLTKEQLKEHKAKLLKLCTEWEIKHVRFQIIDRTPAGYGPSEDEK